MTSDSAIQKEHNSESRSILEWLVGADKDLKVRAGRDGYALLSNRRTGRRIPVYVLTRNDPPDCWCISVEENARKRGPVAALLMMEVPDPELLLWVYRLPKLRVIEAGEVPEAARLRSRLQNLVDGVLHLEVTKTRRPRGQKALLKNPLSTFEVKKRDGVIQWTFNHSLQQFAAELDLEAKTLTDCALRLLVNRFHDLKEEKIELKARDLCVRWRRSLLNRSALLEFLDGSTKTARGGGSTLPLLRGVLVSLLTDGSVPPYSSEAFHLAAQQLEQTVITLALEHARGNQTRTARILGITRNTLQARIRSLDIDPAQYRRSKSRMISKPARIKPGQD